VNYALLMVFLLPCSAMAESAAAEISRFQLEEEFRALDLNGDGYVSAAEAAGYRDVVIRFDKADRNRDGKLSRAEFARLKEMQSRSEATGGTRAAAGGTSRKSPAKKAAN